MGADLDRATESNVVFVEAWEALSKGCPAFESRRGGLIEVAWMGYANPFFNLAVTVRPPDSRAALMDAVTGTCDWAAERRLPWLFALCHETLGELQPEADRLLRDRGLAPMMPLTGMVASDLTAPRHSRPEGPWLIESDPSIGPALIRLNEAAYGMNLGAPGSLAFGGAGWWEAPQRMATVLAPGGEPASCAAVCEVRGLRYVALVATHPSQQRKGYAEAAMRDVLDRSFAAGLPARTYLHASAAGRPVYERMGYSATAEYTVYMPH
jgi:GNAT superfamily N-acetyltransferase